jgi:hypothetical protein
MGPLGHRPLPGWLKCLLAGSAIWLGVALVRGMTFALTHAVHGAAKVL